MYVSPYDEMKIREMCSESKLTLTEFIHRMVNLTLKEIKKMPNLEEYK